MTILLPSISVRKIVISLLLVLIMLYVMPVMVSNPSQHVNEVPAIDRLLVGGPADGTCG